MGERDLLAARSYQKVWEEGRARVKDEGCARTALGDENAFAEAMSKLELLSASARRIPICGREVLL